MNTLILTECEELLATIHGATVCLDLFSEERPGVEIYYFVVMACSRLECMAKTTDAESNNYFKQPTAYFAGKIVGMIRLTLKTVSTKRIREYSRTSFPTFIYCRQYLTLIDNFLLFFCSSNNNNTRP